MRNFLVIFRSSLDGTDLRTIVQAKDDKGAERVARRKVPSGMRCVRIQPR